MKKPKMLLKSIDIYGYKSFAEPAHIVGIAKEEGASKIYDMQFA